MKNSNRLTILITLFFGASVFALAGPTVTQVNPLKGVKLVKPKPQIPYMCPDGWKLATGHFKPESLTVCVLNKSMKEIEKEIKCPYGTESFIDGCMVGCRILVK